jgi:hypothetical protein
MRTGAGDRGDIVLGWLVRLTLVLGALGLMAFDLIALGVGRMQTEDRAMSAARAAVSTWSDTKDVQKAYDAALARVHEKDPLDAIDPTSFRIGEDGSVTLTLEHTSPTLVVEKVSLTRDWATARSTVTSHPPR